MTLRYISGTTGYDASIISYLWAVIEAGETLSNTTGATLDFGAAFKNFVEIEGTLDAFGLYGVYGNGSSFSGVLVEEGGVLSADYYPVYEYSGSGFNVINEGLIESRGSQALTLLSHDGAQVENSGIIRAATIGISIQGDDASVHNTGRIIATGGASLGLDLYGVGAVLTNDGLIRGVIGVQMNSTYGMIVNTGRIIGTNFAIKGVAQGMTVINAGKIVGAIELSSQGDTFIAKAGSVTTHTVDGSLGNDMLIGASGDDDFAGGYGNDRLTGRRGNDTLDGGQGSDEIRGGAGNDRIEGGTEKDTIYGGAGNDRITDSGGHNDDIYGGAGRDFISGSADIDNIWGGRGNDKLFGNGGDDDIRGDAGDDEIVTGTLAGESAYARGGAGNDKITDGAGDSSLDGEAGNDVLIGGGGTDYLEGGDGNDLLKGDSDEDTLGGGAGKDRLLGGDGDDELRGDEGNDKLIGGAGADTFLYTGIDNGRDRIIGFEDGTDLIDARPLHVTTAGGFASTADFVAAAVSNSGGNAVIDLSVLNNADGRIIIIGAAGDIDANDFLF